MGSVTPHSGSLSPQLRGLALGIRRGSFSPHVVDSANRDITPEHHPEAGDVHGVLPSHPPASELQALGSDGRQRSALPKVRCETEGASTFAGR